MAPMRGDATGDVAVSIPSQSPTGVRVRPCQCQPPSLSLRARSRDKLFNSEERAAEQHAASRFDA
jgi:hypothetical protein